VPQPLIPAKVPLARRPIFRADGDQVSYDKTRHSVGLTRRILETEPAQFEEIARLLKEMLKL
jgi:hypothetical protein